MAHRTFRDEIGGEWQVWDARPSAATPARAIAPGLRRGWLCFERAGSDERRRLAPIPFRWPALPESTLRALLAQAAPARSWPAPAPRTSESPFTRPDG